MNSKLKIKLAAKAAKIKTFITGKQYTSDGAGKAAFNEFGGSYGVTINPFSRKDQAFEHGEFRKGFNAARDAKKNIVRGRNNVFRRTPGAFGMTAVLDKQRKEKIEQQAVAIAAY